MNALIDIFLMLVQTANMLIIIWIIIGLLFAFNVVSPSNQFLYAVYDALNRLFEPVLRPIRRFMPDTGQIDFAPMVFLLILFAISRILMDFRY